MGGRIVYLYMKRFLVCEVTCQIASSPYPSFNFPVTNRSIFFLLDFRCLPSSCSHFIYFLFSLNSLGFGTLTGDTTIVGIQQLWLRHPHKQQLRPPLPPLILLQAPLLLPLHHLLRLLLQLQPLQDVNWVKTCLMSCDGNLNTFTEWLQTSPRHSCLIKGRSIIAKSTRKNFKYMQFLVNGNIMYILY